MLSCAGQCIPDIVMRINDVCRSIVGIGWKSGDAETTRTKPVRFERPFAPGPNHHSFMHFTTARIVRYESTMTAIKQQGSTVAQLLSMSHVISIVSASLHPRSKIEIYQPAAPRCLSSSYHLLRSRN